MRADPLAKSYALALGAAIAEAGARRYPPPSLLLPLHVSLLYTHPPRARRGGGAREWAAEPPRQREAAGANADEPPLSTLAVHLAVHRATAEVWPSQPCSVRSSCRDQYVS